MAGQEVKEAQYASSRLRRALVTGGAGFIGSHLCGALASGGFVVTVLDDLSMGSEANLPRGTDFVRGDVRDPDLVRSVLADRDIDVVFHLAAKVSVRASLNGFFEDASNNLMGTLNLLRCMAGSSVKKFVYASSMAVYSDSTSAVPVREDFRTDPISPYGISKLSSEKYCLLMSRELGIDCVVLRYFNTYGVGQALTPYVGVITIFIDRLLKGQPLVIFGDGEQRRDFIHVGDVVAANLLAMARDVSGVILNVGTGTATSVKELALLLRDKIDRDARIVFEKAHPGELRNAVADVDRARNMLGFSPRGRLESEIDQVISWSRRKTGE